MKGEEGREGGGKVEEWRENGEKGEEWRESGEKGEEGRESGEKETQWGGKRENWMNEGRVERKKEQSRHMTLRFNSVLLP